MKRALGRRYELAIVPTYALCLAVGAYNHLVPLLRHGWRWNYGRLPRSTVIFWDALALLDPLIAMLLFLKPRVALPMLAVLMVSDVAHNALLNLSCGCLAVWMIVDQCAFLLFILAIMRPAWRGTSRSLASPWPPSD